MLYTEVVVDTPQYSLPQDSHCEDNCDLTEILDQLRDQLNYGLYRNRVLPDKNLKQIIKGITADLKKSNTTADCHAVTAKLEHIRHDLKAVHGYLLAVSINPNEIEKVASESVGERYIIIDQKSRSEIDELKQRGNDFEANRISEGIYSIKVEQQYEGYRRLIRTRLFHHSLVEDAQENLIECIYDTYPLPSSDYEFGYVFLPHESGKDGYRLKAYSELPFSKD